MSKGFVIGSGMGEIYAAIGVIYPAGSMLSCKDAEETIELAADNTNGAWVFNIPCTGTWTVTATDGTNTKSQTVEITAEGQSVSVTLSYRYYIFEAGKGLASQFTVTKASNSTVKAPTVGTESISFSGAQGSGGTVFRLDPAIDVTDYKMLCVDVELGYNTGGDYSSGFGVGTTDVLSTMVTNMEWAAYAHIDDSRTKIERKTVSVDIAEVTGEVFFKAACIYSAGNIYNIWLE